MKKLVYSIILIPCLVGCIKENKTPEYNSGDITAGKYVAIGSSNSAGYADDALYYDGQSNSVVNLINQQLEKVGFSSSVQPFVNETSVGSSSSGLAKLILGYKTDCTGESSLSPIRAAGSGDAGIFANIYNPSNLFSNISVPYTTCVDAVNAGLGNPVNSNYNPFYGRFASSINSSMLDDASAYNADFFTIYFAENEVLNYARSGGVTPLNPINGASGIGFDGSMEDIILTLSANGAKGAVANIPDVTSFPFFTTIPWNGLVITQQQADDLNQIYSPLGITFYEGANGFAIEDTTQTLDVRLIEEGEYILLTVPLDSIKCHGMGTLNSIPQEYVLTADEVSLLRSYIDSYNDIILNLTQTHDLALVDLNSLYADLSAGITYNGIGLNNIFVSGGAFSLDGRTMTPIGNALIANLFIKSINTKFNAKIPNIDLTDYRGNLFP